MQRRKSRRTRGIDCQAGSLKSEGIRDPPAHGACADSRKGIGINSVHISGAYGRKRVISGRRSYKNSRFGTAVFTYVHSAVLKRLVGKLKKHTAVRVDLDRLLRRYVEKFRVETAHGYI